MHPDVITRACSLYHTSPQVLIPLSGGYSNEVYQFPQGDKFAILRIGVEDCPTEQTLAMLEWVFYLAQQHAPVSTPIPSINGQLLERLEYNSTHYTLTAFEKAEGTLAENIPPSEWADDLFQSIGRAAGRLHRISATYQPTCLSRIRPQWFESYEIQEATNKLAGSTDPAREKLASLITEMQHLPKSATDFGLIHDDLHFANFIIHPSNSVTIIDFDDCVYGWFAMDVAMALFDVLVLYNAASEEEAHRFASRFLSNYLYGYHQENNLSLFWQGQIPGFIKLKELCIYATLIDHPASKQTDGWVGRFMRGRSTRIAMDLPYVDIDFYSV